MASLIKFEYSVQMKDKQDEEVVMNVLKGIAGITSMEVSQKAERVVVETALSSSQIQQFIESTGRRAVLVGAGTGKVNIGRGLTAAVSQLFGISGCNGVVRLIQVDEERCVIEGTVDGLSPGPYKVQIHECGDLSQGCSSCGDIFEKPFIPASKDPMKRAGALQSVEAGNNGRVEFRMETSNFQVPDVIGRSVILQKYYEGVPTERSCCGIIARASGLFENSKRLCACDGVTIWQERDVPLAGGNRSQINKSSG